MGTSTVVVGTGWLDEGRSEVRVIQSYSHYLLGH